MNAFLCIDFSQESRNQDNWDNLTFFSFDIKYTEIKTVSFQTEACSLMQKLGENYAKKSNKNTIFVNNT